jgi:hypothetical protein
MHSQADDARGVAPQQRVEPLLLQVHEASGAVSSAHHAAGTLGRQRQCHHWRLVLHLQHAAMSC